MYIFSVGTFGLIIVLLTALLLIRNLAHKTLGISLDTLLILALLLRILWAIIVIMLEDKGLRYFVYDDETYHLFAMGERWVDSLNGYHVFIDYIYNLFGHSSLNGRLVNLFFSLYTFYPVAIIEYNMTNGESMLATKLTALSPFMVFSSFFEIKDIGLMFFYTCLYAIINQHQGKISVKQAVMLLIIAVFSESLRHGAGVLPIGIFVLNFCLKGIGTSKLQRILTATIEIFIGVFMVLYVGMDYITELTVTLDRYQRWIVTQFSEYSVYNWFVVTSPVDIWKLPFCFLLYVMQPLDLLDGSGRFFAEFGMVAKVFEVPILLMSIVFLPKYIKQEKWASLILILPLAFLSGVNLTNAREGLYLYPLLYIVFSSGLNNMNMQQCKNVVTKTYNDVVIWRNAWITATVLWVLVVSFQLVSKVELL